MIIHPGQQARPVIASRPLPWDSAHIRAFVAETFETTSGTWVMGVVGGMGEFLRPPDTNTVVTANGEFVTAVTEGGALRMRLGEAVWALTLDADGATMAKSRVILAVAVARGSIPVRSGLTDLGLDTEAIDPRARGDVLFDLGLDREEARFCIRTGDKTIKHLLEAHAGTPVDDVLRHIGGTLVTANPVRVIETVVGRMEISSPIPPPDSTSPEGPHTHLLPDQLATKRAVPVGLDLPPAFLPGAIFYPGSD
jgi:hypothetical protein